MHWFISNYLWIIAALPLASGGVIAVTAQAHRRFATILAIGSMGLSFLLSLAVFCDVLSSRGSGTGLLAINFNWFQIGTEWVKIGWLLDPLTAVMLLMVTFVGLLIFVYSIGYMSEDANYTRFFCFISLFAGAMLGVVLSNSLLLLFMCWEIVGLTSYLLIGFWFENPKAAAAAKKAFIVTRIGDLGFFIGMIWLYSRTGTLLLYAAGTGCLEHSALSILTTHTTVLGLSLSSAVGILIFCGAAGKSGQVPLHVWLPDAMEGPTPVSALIHAATMVAAGVFLLARVYPLMSAHAPMGMSMDPSISLEVVTWVGAITALFGAIVAVAQWDIKRILAYSTISQLGYMMIGLGAGGVAVGMFHLITHAFFKALLFLGAGSVIHGCGGEQDIRKMGGLRRMMPVTFLTYTCGMLALCGFPLFAGFWSKDEVLHSAFLWSLSKLPFYMGSIGAFLTAFYMSRQMYYVYAGSLRQIDDTTVPLSRNNQEDAHKPHESPLVMIVPLIILAFFAAFLGFIGTPGWPWFQSFLTGESFDTQHGALMKSFGLMAMSSFVVISGLAGGWFLYGRKPTHGPDDVVDPLQTKAPKIFSLISNAFFIDELYSNTVGKLSESLAHFSVWLDYQLWDGLVRFFAAATRRIGSLNDYAEEFVIQRSFNRSCNGVLVGARVLAGIQSGQTQRYLGIVAVFFAVGIILLIGGIRL